MREFPNILSSYDPDTEFDVLEELKRPGFARWNKGVEIRQTGLPASDAILINSADSDNAILEQIKEFVRRWMAAGARFMVIRYDSAAGGGYCAAIA